MHFSRSTHSRGPRLASGLDAGDAAFPTTQLALLALVRLAEPIALTSILVQYYGISKEHAPVCASLLIAAFALAESASGMFWGGLSDRHGRSTAVSLLVLGFAPSFAVAIASRVLGGLLNGNIGVIQTMAGELIKNPAHEPRVFAVMPFVWSVGCVIGPSIGGLLSSPAENYPRFFSATGVFGRFPYLLPNLVCAALLVVAIACGTVAIKETHPGMQREDCSPADEAPLIPGFKHAPAGVCTNSYGTFGAPTKVDPPKAFNKRVVMLIAALGIFTYHTMTYDNLLPIYLEDDRSAHVSGTGTNYLVGGIGLSTQQVGLVMMVNGAIDLVVQGLVFPAVAAWLGVWRLFVVVTVGHPVVYIVVPYLALLPPTLLYPGLWAALALRNLFAILAYPVLLILIKDASPGPASLGKINGLAASVAAACRTLGSPISGLLYGAGAALGFAPLAWWASAVVAMAGSLQLLVLRRDKQAQAKEQAQEAKHLVAPRMTITTAVKSSMTPAPTPANTPMTSKLGGFSVLKPFDLSAYRGGYDDYDYRPPHVYVSVVAVDAWSSDEEDLLA